MANHCTYYSSSSFIIYVNINTFILDLVCVEEQNE